MSALVIPRNQAESADREGREQAARAREHDVTERAYAELLGPTIRRELLGAFADGRSHDGALVRTIS